VKKSGTSRPPATAKPAATVDANASGDSVLDIRLSGFWRLEDDRTAADTFLRDAALPDGVSQVRFLDAGISEWDSSILVFLRALTAKCRECGIETQTTDLPEGVHRLLALAGAIPERKGARREFQRKNLLTRIGEKTLAGWKEFRESVTFLGELTLAFWAMLRGRASYRKSDLVAVFQECGPDALPIISLISLLVGMIIAFLGSVQLRMFGAEIFVANGVALGMVRAMGPLMTGILMSGRTGAAFAARIGTMQVNEEVDALQTMGFNPMEYLVLPRALALIVMMPLLSIYANFVGIIGGMIIGVLMLDLTLEQYFFQTISAIGPRDVAAGLIQSSVFGVLVAISGCMQGIRCGRSASAVGQATTAAVVNAIVYIVVAASIISILFTITGF
jgi:phospholipid/cholesterol/gamma-HCH transport system permease protein